MQMHRVIVDLPAGTIRPHAFDVFQVIEGTLHYREPLGGFYPVDAEPLHSGERFIRTALHDDPEAAWAQALVELRRRGERLLSLADKFEQQQEHHDA